jgi:molybdopterin converting factor small subunit
MKILFINNDGGGFADYVTAGEGETISRFFQRQLPDRSPEDYLIRVNRQPVAGDYALQDGDRVSMTPTKIEGAARVLFINNDGGGFADYIEIEDGTSMPEFFEQRLPDREPEDYLIRVNRQPVARDYVLRDGDRVSCTPTKIEGAE